MNKNPTYSEMMAKWREHFPREPGTLAIERIMAWEILSALDKANMSLNHPAKAAVDVIEKAIRETAYELGKETP